MKNINGKYRILHTEYASFRVNVREFFFDKVLSNHDTFLDPWAGIASLLPHIILYKKRAFYNDILPLYYFINKAKVYDIYLNIFLNNKDAESRLLKELLTLLDSVKKLRFKISEELISEDVLDLLKDAWEKTENYDSHMKTFFKAIIVLCVRSYSNHVQSSSHHNWVMCGGIAKNPRIRELVKAKIELYKNYYEYYYGREKIENVGRCTFGCEDGLKLRLRNKFDVIFTSPSYRNGTDVYNMYLPELHFLKYVGYAFRPSDLIGTNMVRDHNYGMFENDLKYLGKISPKTKSFIKSVIEVQSEKSYYYPRVFARHYARLFKSIEKFLNYVSPNGKAYFVVQTNIHRGLINDMGEFILDFLVNSGYQAKIVGTKYVTHMGKRNISRKYPVIIDKVPENIIEVTV